MSKAPPPKPTDSELEILHVLWQHGPATVRTINDNLSHRRRVEVGYTLRGVSYLLHRMGYSLQVPARRAVERDPEAITTWQRKRWPAVKG